MSTIAYQKSLLRDLFIILFLCFFQACARDNRPVVKIGVSVPNTNTTSYNLIQKAIFDQLAEHNLTAQSDRIEIIWNSVQDQANGKNAVAMEFQQVKTMLNQGIKVLVLNSIDPRSAHSILRETKRKSVPVLTLDEPIRNDQIVGHFSINQSRLGEIAAAYVVQKLKDESLVDKSNVLVLEGPLGSPVFRQLKIGIYRILDQYPQVHILSKYSKADKSSGRQLASQTLRDYAQNVQAIICVNSGLAVGAVEGVNLYDMAEKIITIGIGAERSAINLIIAGQHDAEVDLQSYERGQMILQSAIDIYNDQPFQADQEKTQFAPSRIITTSNYTILEKIWPDLHSEKIRK